MGDFGKSDKWTNQTIDLVVIFPYFPSISLSTSRLSQKLFSSHISFFLTKINPPLVKSQMKPSILDGT